MKENDKNYLARIFYFLDRIHIKNAIAANIDKLLISYIKENGRKDTRLYLKSVPRTSGTKRKMLSISFVYVSLHKYLPILYEHLLRQLDASSLC